jgi:hypothetical protein
MRYGAAVLDVDAKSGEGRTTDDEEVWGEAVTDGPQELVEVMGPRGEVGRGGTEGRPPDGGHEPACSLCQAGRRGVR